MLTVMFFCKLVLGLVMLWCSPFDNFGDNLVEIIVGWHVCMTGL